MGWDAYAEPLRRRYDWKKDWTVHHLDEPARTVFAEAIEEVKRHADCYDGGLETGMLDISFSAFALEAATGRSCWDEDWSPEDVRFLAQVARWDLAAEHHKPMYVWSARVFLEACAKLGLGIHFSW